MYVGNTERIKIRNKALKMTKLPQAETEGST